MLGGAPLGGFQFGGSIFSTIYAAVFNESVAIQDRTNRFIHKIFTQTGSLADQYLTAIGLTFASGLTINDLINRSIDRIFTHTLPVTESIIRSIHKTFTRSLTVADSIMTYFVEHIILTQVFTVADSISRSIHKIFTLPVSIVESILRSINKVLTTELPTVADTITSTFFIQKLFEVSISVQDSVLRSIGKVFALDLGVTDQLIKLRAVFATFSEVVQATELFSFTLAMVFNLKVSIRLRLRRWLDGILILYNSYYKNKGTEYDPYKYTERGNEYSDGYSSKPTEYTKKYRDNE